MAQNTSKTVTGGAWTSAYRCWRYRHYVSEHGRSRNLHRRYGNRDRAVEPKHGDQVQSWSGRGKSFACGPVSGYFRSACVRLCAQHGPRVCEPCV